jgi:hypothetical protein
MTRSETESSPRGRFHSGEPAIRSRCQTAEVTSRRIFFTDIFLEIADAFYARRREDVSSKSITDVRSGNEKPRRSREVQRSPFARFSGLFDFRLLQRYPSCSGTRREIARCLGRVKSSGQPNARAASGFPQTADMVPALALFSSGPSAEMMSAAPILHSVLWMSLAPSITGPPYPDFVFPR